MHIVTPFDMGVYCESGVLTWVGHCHIGKCKCRVYAPSPYPTRISFEPGELNKLDAPNQANYYTLPEGYKGLGWPLEDWGYINSERSITVRVGCVHNAPLTESPSQLQSYLSINP